MKRKSHSAALNSGGGAKSRWHSETTAHFGLLCPFHAENTSENCSLQAIIFAIPRKVNGANKSNADMIDISLVLVVWP